MSESTTDASNQFVLYFLDEHLGAAPTVLELARVLAARGHDVEIRAFPSYYGAAVATPAGCRLTWLRRFGSGPISAPLARLLRRLNRPAAVTLLELAGCVIRDFLRDFREHTPAALRRTNIGVDTRGLVLACAASAAGRGVHVLLSLELPLAQVSGRLDRLLRWIDCAAVRSARAVAIQDEDRLATLAKCYPELPASRYFLPNSTGPACPTPTSSLLRARLGIDPQRFPTLVLQAGMLNDLSYAQEITGAFAEIGEGCALVLHDRMARESTDPYIERLRARNSRNLFLSLRPVPLQEVDALFASATITLALYRPVDANFGQISKASGKLSFSLKHGLPVIMNALPSFAALNARYGFGELVSDPANSDEVRAALRKILANYDTYRANARRCFHDEFDFDRHAAPFIHFLTA